MNEEAGNYLASCCAMKSPDSNWGLGKKFVAARTPQPARETRTLPGIGKFTETWWVNAVRCMGLFGGPRKRAPGPGALPRMCCAVQLCSETKLLFNCMDTAKVGGNLFPSVKWRAAHGFARIVLGDHDSPGGKRAACGIICIVPRSDGRLTGNKISLPT